MDIIVHKNKAYVLQYVSLFFVLVATALFRTAAVVCNRCLILNTRNLKACCLKGTDCGHAAQIEQKREEEKLASNPFAALKNLVIEPDSEE